jgi:hypothetical protein
LHFKVPSFIFPVLSATIPHIVFCSENQCHRVVLSSTIKGFSLPGLGSQCFWHRPKYKMDSMILRIRLIT